LERRHRTRDAAPSSIAAGWVTGYSHRGDETARRRTGLVVETVVALDQLRAGDVVNFIVLVTGVGDPAAGEYHDAAAGDCFALLVEIVELVGDPASEAADGIAHDATDRGADQQRYRHDQQAQRGADAEGQQSERDTDRG